MKQYQKLLLKREAKELIGRRASHLWLLVLMLVATFASIAFSEGSQNYLKYRMADPFTNWVSIAKSNDDASTDNDTFNKFRDSLYLDENKERFDYRDVLISMKQSFTMGNPDGRSDFITGRFFEHLNTALIHKVLSEDNVVEGCQIDSTLLTDESMGIIITEKTAERLGYTAQSLPPYIHYWAHNEGADSLGLELKDVKFLPVALPVLAIVKRLPNNAQMVANIHLYEQLRNGSGNAPFDFAAHRNDYQRQLTFFVAEGLKEDFQKTIKKLIPDSLQKQYDVMEAGDNYQYMRTWKPGVIMQVNLGDASIPLKVYQDIANAMSRHFTDATKICQVYNFETQKVETPRSMFLSVEFNSLNRIHEFEEFARAYHIQMELEQVRTMENFVAVTQMAKILSGAMVLFSIVCIIMFMVNMLQSYFQKVKRNIGTFKAFGMNGRELIVVYILLLIMIVFAAVVIALLLTWAIQGALLFCGIDKDGFNYLSLWHSTTYVATAVIFAATIFTVIIVMVRMLGQTPGDLIYDRN
jgi:hypothetical protein